ncbi:hypothetical protein RFI_35339, partial [Reticulomyxa filosa]
VFDIDFCRFYYFIAEILIDILLFFFVKGRDVEMIRNGSSYRKVAKKFKVSHECVSKWFLSFKKDSRILKKQRTGRPQKIPLRLHRIIVRWMITSKHFKARDQSGLSTITKKKPLLTMKQKKARYEFALEHESWTIEDWKKKSKIWWWKYFSLVMFWSIMNSLRLQGVNTDIYKEILSDETLNSVNFCLENKKDWIFQQDNATCHKSEKIMK